MCTIFKSAVGRELPHAQLVVDHFHLVQLANATVTEVRRRVTVQVRGRRGRKGNREWELRNRLTRNAGRVRAEDGERPRSRTVRATRTYRPADPGRVERQGGPARPTRAGPHRAGP